MNITNPQELNVVNFLQNPQVEGAGGVGVVGVLVHVYN